MIRVSKKSKAYKSGEQRGRDAFRGGRMRYPGGDPECGNVKEDEFINWASGWLYGWDAENLSAEV